MIKQFGFILFGIVCVVSLTSCGKKEATLVDMQEAATMESVVTDDPIVLTAVAPTGTGEAGVVAPSTGDVPLLVQPTATGELVKPSDQDIQTALKNAGYYQGKIDGNIGPMSKKAIEDFQRDNGLVVDGKVGPKTWGALSRHLNSAPAVLDVNVNAGIRD